LTPDRIAAAFDRARSESRAAFIPYLTAGDPSAEATVAFAKALDRAGADILELGVPFSDPIADGPVLLNPLLRRGLENTARSAKRAGFDAVLVTDLPPEEGKDVAALFRNEGLETVFLVSPTSPRSRMARAAQLSTGFLYVVTRAGTTGARRDLPADLAKTVARARRSSRGNPRGSLPIAVGFGISTPAAARLAATLADGVVVGSALVAVTEEAGEGAVGAVGRFAGRLVRACRRKPA